eukprot:TRINITY_DN1312_c0_g1_i3.p1 TRINITY_DN1312_c0_g1~~TRINITY_DN1312_c0_g1_i3.p1  ORF type:complete len:574 (+),score=230.13 TRINITY_DN1312_c0_g1_i3:280-2001(+)
MTKHQGGAGMTAEEWEAQCCEMGVAPAQGLPFAAVLEGYEGGGEAAVEADLRLSQLGVDADALLRAAVEHKHKNELDKARELAQQRKALEAERAALIEARNEAAAEGEPATAHADPVASASPAAAVANPSTSSSAADPTTPEPKEALGSAFDKVFEMYARDGAEAWTLAEANAAAKHFGDPPVDEGRWAALGGDAEAGLPRATVTQALLRPSARDGAWLMRLAELGSAMASTLAEGIALKNAKDIRGAQGKLAQHKKLRAEWEALRAQPVAPATKAEEMVETVEEAKAEAAPSPPAGDEDQDTMQRVFAMFSTDGVHWTHANAALAAKSCGEAPVPAEKWAAHAAALGHDPAVGLPFPAVLQLYRAKRQRPRSAADVLRLATLWFDIARLMDDAKASRDAADLPAMREALRAIKDLREEQKEALAAGAPPAPTPSAVASSAPAPPQPAAADDPVRKLFDRYGKANAGFWNRGEANHAAEHLGGPPIDADAWAEQCAAVGADPARGLPAAVIAGAYADGGEDVAAHLKLSDVGFELDACLAEFEEAQAQKKAKAMREAFKRCNELKKLRAALLK